MDGYTSLQVSFFSLSHARSASPTLPLSLSLARSASPTHSLLRALFPSFPLERDREIEREREKESERVRAREKTFLSSGRATSDRRS